MPQDTTRNDAIHVALTFDDKYWAPAYATMRSIAIVSQRRASIVFHLLHFGLSDDHRKDLEYITDEFGSKIVFYDLLKNQDILDRIAQLPTVKYKHLHAIVYIRLFLDKIIDQEAKRLIYLDCDMMVREPIEQLAYMDLEGHPIAAAVDPYRTGFQTGRDFLPKSYFDTTDYYFNAGLMVIDRDAFAATDVVPTVLSKVTEAEFQRLYYDQDMLNIAFRNNWKQLSPMWNLQNPSWPHEALDPHLIHYTGTNKPWYLFSRTAFKRNYRHIMRNEYFYRFLRERLVRRYAFLKPFISTRRPETEPPARWS